MSSLLLRWAVVGVALWQMSIPVTSPHAFAQQIRPAEASLIGRLHAVDPDAMRLWLLPDGRKDPAEIVVEAATEIRLGTSVLTIRSLVPLVGARAKVRYRLDARRQAVARLITVDRPRGR